MHSIKDLEDSLGQSYEQIRTRVNELSDNFEGITETGKRNKTLVTDKGISLLRRLKQLERKGYSVEASVNEIEKDLSSNGSNGNGKDLKDSEGLGETELENLITLKVEKKQLEARLNDLKQQLNVKDRQIERKDDQIMNLLPSATKKYDPEEERVSLWGAVKMWWKSPF